MLQKFLYGATNQRRILADSGPPQATKKAGRSRLFVMRRLVILAPQAPIRLRPLRQQGIDAIRNSLTEDSAAIYGMAALTWRSRLRDFAGRAVDKNQLIPCFHPAQPNYTERSYAGEGREIRDRQVCHSEGVAMGHRNPRNAPAPAPIARPGHGESRCRIVSSCM